MVKIQKTFRDFYFMVKKNKKNPDIFYVWITIKNLLLQKNDLMVIQNVLHM